MWERRATDRTAEICNVHDYGMIEEDVTGQSAARAEEGCGDQADRFSLRVGNRNGNNSWNELFRDRRDLAMRFKVRFHVVQIPMYLCNNANKEIEI